ncbi:MAG: T9SS type A sorting domain-containing protein [Bacteroidota bacterium]
MKTYSTNYRISIGFLLSLFLFLTTVNAQPDDQFQGQDDKDPPKYDTLVIIKTNWVNPMGCAYGNPNLPCIALGTDNELIFKIRIRMAEDDITSYPTMRVSYAVQSQLPGGTSFSNMTAIITNSMLSPVLLDNGANAYEAVFEINVPLDNDCQIEELHQININYLLIRADNNLNTPYPTATYPSLFPPAIFQISASGYAELHQHQKDICCDGIVDPKSECPENSSSRQLDVQNTLTIPASIFPNPFSGELNVHYTLDRSTKVEFKLWNAQGQLIQGSPIGHKAPGNHKMTLLTTGWSAGVYYIQLQTVESNQVSKVIKLN